MFLCLCAFLHNIMQLFNKYKSAFDGPEAPFLNFIMVTYFVWKNEVKPVFKVSAGVALQNESHPVLQVKHLVESV